MCLYRRRRWCNLRRIYYISAHHHLYWRLRFYSWSLIFSPIIIEKVIHRRAQITFNFWCFKIVGGCRLFLFVYFWKIDLCAWIHFLHIFVQFCSRCAVLVVRDEGLCGKFLYFDIFILFFVDLLIFLRFQILYLINNFVVKLKFFNKIWIWKIYAFG